MAKEIEDRAALATAATSCPFCKAAVGEPCVHKRMQRPLSMGKVHIERTSEYLKIRNKERDKQNDD